MVKKILVIKCFFAIGVSSLILQLKFSGNEIFSLNDDDIGEEEDSFGHRFYASVKHYSVPLCKCSRYGKSIENTSSEETSTCSEFSTQRGINQTVFSYSYYHPMKKYGYKNKVYLKYLSAVPDRAREIQSQFPGWVLRLYHNISLEDVVGTQMLCQLFCNYPNVDICDVTKLSTIGNLSAVQPIGRMWRFAVMGDPTVNIFNIRDTDSAILPREATAMEVWLNSDKTFHVMRDHPRHLAVIMAGLWGSKNYRMITTLKSIREDIFNQTPRYDKGFDQELLALKLWPIVKKDVLTHVSFSCMRFGFPISSIPFPTKREDGLYVGWGPFKVNERNFVRRSKCNKACRPPNHQDWKQC